MHHRIRRRFPHGAQNRIRIPQITHHQPRPRIHGGPVPILKAVKNNNLMPLIEQHFGCHTPNVAGPACDQNLHGAAAEDASPLSSA